MTKLRSEKQARPFPTHTVDYEPRKVLSLGFSCSEGDQAAFREAGEPHPTQCASAEISTVTLGEMPVSKMSFCRANLD